MKKILSLILCLLVVLSFSAPALARDGASPAKVTQLTEYEYDSIFYSFGKMFAQKSGDANLVGVIGEDGKIIGEMKNEDEMEMPTSRYIMQPDFENGPIGCDVHESCFLDLCYMASIYDTVEQKAITDNGYITFDISMLFTETMAQRELETINPPTGELTEEEIKQYIDEALSKGITVSLGLTEALDGLFLTVKKIDNNYCISFYNAPAQKVIVDFTAIPDSLLTFDTVPKAADIINFIKPFYKSLISYIDIGTLKYNAFPADLSVCPSNYIEQVLDQALQYIYQYIVLLKNDTGLIDPMALENQDTLANPGVMAIYYFDVLVNDIFDISNMGTKVSEDFELGENDYFYSLDLGMCALDRISDTEYNTVTVYDYKGDIILDKIYSIDFLKPGFYSVGKYNADTDEVKYALVKITDMPVPSSPKSVSFTDGDKKISITADKNIVPYDSSFKIELVNQGKRFAVVSSSLGSTSDKFTAYDISLLVNSMKVQPNGKIKVSLPIPAGYDKSLLSIAYIDDAGKVTTISSTINGNFIEFETDHLSTYAVVQAKAPVTTPPTGDKLPLFVALCAVALVLSVFSIIRGRKTQEK